MPPCVAQLFLLATCASSLETSCEITFPVQTVVGAESIAATTLQRDWDLLITRGLYAASTNLSGYLPLADDEVHELNVNASEEDAKCQPSTFWEMNALRLFMDERFPLGESDVFVDLGSGIGKSVLGAVLFFNVSEGVGVELAASRFERSCVALRNLSHVVRSPELCGVRCQERVKRSGRITMVHSNMLDYDLARATAVSVFATCYPANVQEALLDKLLRELKPGARLYAPGQKWIKPILPRYGKILVPLASDGPFGSTYRVDMSHDAEL